VLLTLLALIAQSGTDVRIDPSIPLWELITGIMGAAFILGGLAVRVYMHSRYHRDHYAHANDRAAHPDPRLADQQMQTLREGQIRVNDAMERHLESDIKANERVDAMIEGFRKENRENSEKLQATLEDFRRQAAKQNEQIIKVLGEVLTRR